MCLRKYSEKIWNRAFIIISSHDFHFHSNNHSLVAETGEGPGGSCHLPLFLDQTEARRTEKKIGETGPLLNLREWMTAPPPPLTYSKLYNDNLKKSLFEWNVQEVISEIAVWLPRR